MDRTREIEKLVKRHTRFSGGVQVRWLSQETGIELAHVKAIVQALGYRAVSENWFLPKNKIYSHDVFYHALRKMFQYCGPLPVDDICSGIRRAVSRTSFPVPPPDVMEQILQMCGSKNEGGRYDWDGETGEDLSAGESAIMDCLEQDGPVVHHSELAQAIMASGLPFSSLRTTLNRSPLFEGVGTGLYKLRGKRVTGQDIERARSAAERTPVNLEIEYDKTGKIIARATLSIRALGTGVISSEQLPNLSGEWDCFVQGKPFGKLEATANAFRRLDEPLKFLNCQVGDRVKFTFNTWDRSVILEKA